MNLFNNQDIRNLLLIIFTYIVIAYLPIIIMIILTIIYLIEIGNGPHTSGFILVLGIPYIISFIIKPIILPGISIFICRNIQNVYIRKFCTTFKMSFTIFIIFSFIDIILFLILNYFNFFLADILLYISLLSITSSYLPFYIVSFFCALKYKFFNNRINRQNR